MKKIYIMKPENLDSGTFLDIRSAPFSNSNREQVREHVKTSEGTDYVWFDDEEFPDEFVRLMIISKIQKEDWWYVGEQLAKVLKDNAKVLPLEHSEPWLEDFCHEYSLDVDLVLDSLRGDHIPWTP